MSCGYSEFVYYCTKRIDIEISIDQFTITEVYILLRHYYFLVSKEKT